ncbi:MAG: hypothetical protein NUV77_09920, partial [Thermoguttaceae bacterium]|nr:hypothetical protein [Thermoguttaceae bacterium]
MSQPPEFHTAILVASVSGDPIVLAKLLHAVRPAQLVLYSTPEARRRGWEKNARSVLEVCAARGLGLTAGFVRLEVEDTQTQGRWMSRQIFQTVDSFCAAHLGRGGVAFDCTTGQGILRILGYDAARRAAVARQRPFCTVYCDGDRNEVLFAGLAGDGWQFEARPVRFDCR